MDEYSNLCYSAFSKAQQICSGNLNITIGPETKLHESPKVKTPVKIEETSPRKPKTPKQIEIIATSTASPIRKILVDLEKLRLEEVQAAVQKRKIKMIEFQKEQEDNKRREWYRQQQHMIAKVQEQEYQIFQVLEEHNKNAVVKNEKLVKDYQAIVERMKKKDEELQEKERKKKELMMIIDALKKNHAEFKQIVQEVVSLTKTPNSEHIKVHLGHISNQLKQLVARMEEVFSKCKSGNVENKDIEISNECLQSTALFKRGIEDDLRREAQTKIELANKEKQKLEEQAKLKEEAKLQEQAKLAEQAKIEEAKSIREVDTSRHQSVEEQVKRFVSRKSLKIYSELQDFQLNYEKSYDGLLREDSLKQFRFDLKKAINIPVNAISGVNSQHLLDKFNRLSQLLSGNRVQIGDKYVSASAHPQGIAFCMDLLAKKFVHQGDLMISSNPEAAFFYATIILSLWNLYPDFGKLLIAHFHKQCPYLVPIYLPKRVDQSNQEYYESLGYKYNEDNVVEKQDKFLKRMTGIMRLYSAILIGKPKRDQNGKTPLGLEEGWRFISAILNLEPTLDITATMLHVFLETTGYQMEATYGRQFIKMIVYLQTVFLPMLKKIDTGGPVTRLEGLLQDYCKKGSFTKPSGPLPNNFW